MLPSVISNFIWGYGSAESEEDSGQLNEVDFDHSTSDEPGDWLLITCEKPGRYAGAAMEYVVQQQQQQKNKRVSGYRYRVGSWESYRWPCDTHLEQAKPLYR